MTAVAAVAGPVLAQPSPAARVDVGGASYPLDVDRHRGYAAFRWSRVPAEVAAGSFQTGGGATATVAGAALELRAGSPFGRHGESVFQLVNVPYVEEGEVWVPLELLTEWLPRVEAGAAERPVAASTSVAAPVVTTAASGPRPAPTYRRPGPWRVVIDAGHGGYDPGTVSPRTGTREKDITLSVARKLARELESGGSVQPLLTRDSDRHVKVMDRPTRAVEMDADLFISLHVDAQPNRGTSASGFTTFYLGRARTDDALQVALRENAVIELEEGSEAPNMNQVEFILGTITRDEYRVESRALAGRIQNGLRGAMGSRDRGVKPGPYYVLMTPGLLPAVLVELGFITNRGDEAKLRDEAVQEGIARSLAASIRDYLDDAGRRIETMEGRG